MSLCYAGILYPPHAVHTFAREAGNDARGGVSDDGQRPAGSTGSSARHRRDRGHLSRGKHVNGPLSQRVMIGMPTPKYARCMCIFSESRFVCFGGTFVIHSGVIISRFLY